MTKLKKRFKLFVFFEGDIPVKDLIERLGPYDAWHIHIIWIAESKEKVAEYTLVIQAFGGKIIDVMEMQ